MTTLPLTTVFRERAASCANSASITLYVAACRAPASLTAKRLVERSSRRSPEIVSRRATARVTEAGEQPRRRAAAASDPSSTTARNIDIASSRSRIVSNLEIQSYSLRLLSRIAKLTTFRGKMKGLQNDNQIRVSAGRG